MGSDEFAGLAIMMNLGHWVFAKHIDSVDFDVERDAIIHQLKQGLHELIFALKCGLPGASVWTCPETCVRVGLCKECHRSDYPMFKVYYESAYLDEQQMQRIREGIVTLVKRLLPLSEAQGLMVAADAGRQIQMVRIGCHHGAVSSP